MELLRKNKIALGLIVIALIVGAIIIYNKRQERPAGEALGNFLLLGALQEERLCMIEQIGEPMYELYVENPELINETAVEALANCI